MPDNEESVITSSKLWSGTANDSLAEMFTRALGTSLYEGVGNELSECKTDVVDDVHIVPVDNECRHRVYEGVIVSDSDEESEIAGRERVLV